MAKKATGKKAKAISLDALSAEVQSMVNDVEKFNGGVNAPGSRIRKACQNIKAICQQMRKDVIDIKGSR